MSDPQTSRVIEPEAGDVILLDHGPQANFVSRKIREVTCSPYSHTILALGGGQFTDAIEALPGVFQQRGRDVRIWSNLDQLKKVTAHLYRLAPNEPRPDGRLLLEIATRYSERSEPDHEQKFTEFDTGAMSGLAVLRLLTVMAARAEEPGAEPSALSSEEIKGLQRACIVVLNDGIDRLFCSEYVYRVLTDAGFRPRLPSRPFIVVPGYVTDDEGFAPFDAIGGFIRWAKSHVNAIKLWIEKTTLTVIEAGEIGAFLERVRDEYEQPTKTVPQLERANFFVPGDFVERRVHLASRAPAVDSLFLSPPVQPDSPCPKPKG